MCNDDDDSKSYHQVKNIAQQVWNELGPGYAENIYQKAMLREFTIQNISFETEKVIPVYYKYNQIGFVRADIVAHIYICGKKIEVIIETKVVSNLTRQHELQLLLYGKQLNNDKLMLINFPIKDSAEISCMVHTGDHEKKFVIF